MFAPEPSLGSALRGLCCGWLVLVAGCDASVVSVGAWQPVVEQGGASFGGALGVSGAVGAGGDATHAGAAGAASDTGPGLYLEAESGELSGGFTIVADAAASNGQYIQPPTGPALDDPPSEGTPRARYTFTLPESGDYVLWGRIYSPDVSSNRFWFQVDGGEWNVWRITVGEIWFWDDFHVDLDYGTPLLFPFAAGTHELVIAKDASSARLDRLYVTAEGDTPPGNDTPCRPPHTIDRGGVCFPSCGSQAPPGMRTSCETAECDGRPAITSYDCAICCAVP